MDPAAGEGSDSGRADQVINVPVRMPIADVACEACGARYVIPINIAPCGCLECGARPVKSILYASQAAMDAAVAEMAAGVKVTP